MAHGEKSLLNTIHSQSKQGSQKRKQNGTITTEQAGGRIADCSGPEQASKQPTTAQMTNLSPPLPPQYPTHNIFKG